MQISRLVYRCLRQCRSVSLGKCVCVCLTVSVWLCEFRFPSATTSSDNDNDNACTAIRDLLHLTLCFLSTKTHLFTYYYYFCFLARSLARQRQRQHTSLLFVFINCMYLNAVVHVNETFNNWVLLLMLPRVAAWQQSDCDADCSNSKLFMRDLMATSFFSRIRVFCFVAWFCKFGHTTHTLTQNGTRTGGGLAGAVVVGLLRFSQRAHTT